MNEVKLPASGAIDCAGFRLASAGVETFKRGSIALAIGLLAFSFLGLRRGEAGRFMLVYLAAFAFYLTLSLGGLFFVLLHHLTGARWSIVLRRLAESLALMLPLCLVLFIPILGWLPSVYPWAAKEAAGDALIQAKAAYLNVPFFVLRSFLYFTIWIALAGALARLSRRQDATGDPALTVTMRRLSAPGTLIFAVTLTFASFDWLMSLDPHWYSTIFGVYVFAGAAVAVYAALIPIALALTASGPLAGAVTVEHFHDLGKLLFAFVIFWAYIAFSQMMLIWYGNLPEETIWFARRWNPPFWRAVSLLLLAGHFVLPLLFLLPRTIKRTPPLLALAAAGMLVMHAVDVYWLVLPVPGGMPHPFRLGDVAMFAGLGCLYGAVYLTILQRQPLVPVGDPRLAESIAFENR